MITVARKMLSEKEVREKLALLSRRYHLPSTCCEEWAADRMSDFDALEWLSLCDMLKAAKRRRQYSSVDLNIPGELRSIYGMAALHFEELENHSSLIELAA